MGIYLNPGNSGFSGIRNDTYVDKSGLVGLINRTIDTPRRLTCVSRPRRFGKSFAAKMLCAYYDRSCDSASLFEGLAVASDETFESHRNRYDVIYVDMTFALGLTDGQNFVPFIQHEICRDLTAAYPQLSPNKPLAVTMLEAAALTGTKFIMIIDEWDAPIRETPSIQDEYLTFLRMLFKSSGTTDKIFAAAYMTGILPIKKDGSQSAISDFKEYTMIKPRIFGPYVGFTECEVKSLCAESGVSFVRMKQWYDGYSFRGVESIYNPNSVMEAVRNDDFDSYWTETSAAVSLMEYISMDFDGLSKTVAELIGGLQVPVQTEGFANDLTTFRNRDDVLTLLIHLGYLAYDEETRTVRIPNEEIRLEFAKTIRDVKRDETIRRVRESDRLIADTIHRDADAVAAQIEKIHTEETTPLFYNNEQALRAVIKLAYFSYRNYYVKFEELPAGRGYADIAYLPRKGSLYPPLVIELKWDKSAKTALDQIRNREYPSALDGYGGEVLLVGINYDRNAPPEKRKHTCVIEAVTI